MVRKLFLCCVVGSCITLLLGCPKKKDDGADAGDEAGAVAVAPAVDAAPVPVAPVGKNAADVARFPAEKPLADDDAKILDPFTQAKSGCKSGALVAAVKLGTDPFKVAEFQDCFLVTFPDPKDPAGNLLGWIPKSSFVGAPLRDAGVKDATTDGPVVDAAVAVLPLGKCPAGQEAVNIANLQGLCRRKCSTDKDCKNPVANACAAAATFTGKITKVCANETP